MTDPNGWQPIETAPKDGSVVILGNEYGTWVGHFVERYTSGYHPPQPWHSLMLNHRHFKKRHASSVPAKWQPLPDPPHE